MSNKSRIALIASTIMLALSLALVAQSSNHFQILNTTILNIQQAVPIVADILVPINGEEIRASVPMTLNVSLQVDLASQQIAQVQTSLADDEGVATQPNSGGTAQQVLDTLSGSGSESPDANVRAPDTPVGAGDIDSLVRWTPENIIEVEGEMKSDTVWSTGNLYVITGEFVVSRDTTLTIEPGVVVKVDEEGVTSNRGCCYPFSIFVNGTLVAEGTEDAPIVFTSLYDDAIAGDTNGDASNSTARPGAWQSIVFGAGSDTSILKHVSFRYAGRGLGYANSTQNSAIILDSSSPTLDSVTVEASGTGVTTLGRANPIIRNSLFLENESSGILTGENSSAVILNSEFRRNKGYAVSSHPSSPPQLQNVQFIGNGGNALGLYYGNIKDESIWSFTEYPIVILGEVTVETGSILTIEPGVVVKVDEEGVTSNRGCCYPFSIFVNGTLVAEGTEDAPIVFTSLYDDAIAGDTNGDASNSTARPGAWQSIVFGAGSDTSILKHVSFRYAGRGLGYANSTQNSAIILDSSSPTLDSVTVEASGTGVTTLGRANPIIRNSLFLENESSGILTGENSSAVILNSEFRRNKGYAVSSHPSSPPQLQNVQFIGNGGNALGLYYGNIKDESIWSFTEYPIVILGEVTVETGSILTIEPGVVVKVDEEGVTSNRGCCYPFSIFVNGTLVAEGTEDAPIVFTSLYDDAIAGDTNGDASNSTARPGAWQSIVFGAGSDTSILKHVSFRYAGRGLGYANSTQNSAIILDSSSPTLDSVTVEESQGSEVSCIGNAVPQLAGTSNLQSESCP